MIATKQHTDVRQIRQIREEIESLERKRVETRRGLLRLMADQQAHGVRPGETLITAEHISSVMEEMREELLLLHEKYQRLL